MFFKIVSQVTTFPVVWGNIILCFNEIVCRFTSIRKKPTNPPKTQQTPTAAHSSSGTEAFLGLFWICRSSSSSEEQRPLSTALQLSPEVALDASRPSQVSPSQVWWDHITWWRPRSTSKKNTSPSPQCSQLCSSYLEIIDLLRSRLEIKTSTTIVMLL